MKNIIREIRNGDPLHLRINPAKDWKIVLISFFCLVAVAFLFEYLVLSVSVGNLSGVTTNPTSSLVSIDKVKLSKTLNEWKVRETKFNDLIGSKPEVLIDPSL